MTQDCSVSHPTADETNRFQTSDDNKFLKGKHVSEPNQRNGAEVEVHPNDNTAKYKPLSWCYLFVHHAKVIYFEERLKADGLTYFIHKTIKYVPRHRNHGGVREVEKPTVSGLIFIQGNAKKTQNYLNENLFSYRLCKDRCTGRVATIPNSQMEPFMRVSETDPSRIRFLLKPFTYYTKNHTLLRILTGDYAGLEGYVIRIARDRRLVMNVGGMAIALSGIHAERFEEVYKNEGSKQERATFYKRNLHERNAFIDRYFHQVKSAQDVAAQTENIETLRLQILMDVENKKLDLKEAFYTYYFMIEEIVYYYAPFIDRFKDALNPIFEAGNKVLTELDKAIAAFRNGRDAELSQRCETEYEELKAQYGYLFE